MKMKIAKNENEKNNSYVTTNKLTVKTPCYCDLVLIN